MSPLEVIETGFKPFSVTSSMGYLYTADVMHQRLWPKKHRFSYRLFWFGLNIRTLQQQQTMGDTASWPKGFRFGNMAPQKAFLGYGLYASDHFPEQVGETLQQKLAQVLAPHHIDLPHDAQIFALLQCRLWGYVFNPVCFWFCANAQNQPLAVVAEVRNTFQAVKNYVLTQDPQHRDWWVCRQPKAFYVSPFLHTEDWFMFRVRWVQAGQPFVIGVHTLAQDNQTPLLVSTFTGQALPLDTQTLWGLTLRYPWVPGFIIASIHWQAVQLWFKKIRFYPYHTK